MLLPLSIFKSLNLFLFPSLERSATTLGWRLRLLYIIWRCFGYNLEKPEPLFM